MHNRETAFNNLACELVAFSQSQIPTSSCEFDFGSGKIIVILLPPTDLMISAYPVLRIVVHFSNPGFFTEQLVNCDHLAPGREQVGIRLLNALLNRMLLRVSRYER